MKKMRIIENGTITSVRGIRSSGVVADIKGKKTGKKDVAVIYSETDCVSAGVFTTNRVRSKTIDICREHLAKGNLRAIVINSGNANACVGQKGYDDAKKMVEITAKELGLKPEEVGVSSTGVIGVKLPMERVEAGIKEAVKALSDNGGMDTVEAIMTTDIVKKNIAVEIDIDGKIVTIAGIAKGSGMIHPNMATMLGYVTTDVKISKELLQILISKTTDRTFNMISVDRDTSTNDSLFAIATGAAENKEITDINSLECKDFADALYYVLEYLAKAIAKDGEGATKLIEVEVVNALDFKEAKAVGISVITSPLVKTAIFGEDANWGRIIAATGYSGAEVEEEKIDIYVGDAKVCENGGGIMEDETLVNQELKKKEVRIKIDLKRGNESVKVWGCDLTQGYIEINADYRS